MWEERESNPRHKDFQSFALPTELPSRIFQQKIRRIAGNLLKRCKDIIIFQKMHP